jgi:hypothetical protein
MRRKKINLNKNFKQYEVAEVSKYQLQEMVTMLNFSFQFCP